MAFVTVEFTRVFDILRFHKRYITQFSFEAAGKRQLSVIVPGHPRIEPGITVTASLTLPALLTGFVAINPEMNGLAILLTVITSLIIAAFMILKTRQEWKNRKTLREIAKRCAVKK